MTASNNQQEVELSSIDAALSEPAGLCDLIGYAFRSWRRNLPFIFKVMLAPTLVVALAKIVVQASAVYGFSGVSDLSDIGRMLIWGLLAFLATIAVVFAGWYVALRQLALTRLVSGASSDWPQAWSYIDRKKFYLVGIYLFVFPILVALMIFWMIAVVISAALTQLGPAGTVAATIGMVVALIGVLVSSGIWAMAASLILSVFACTDLPFFAVIRTGCATCFRHIWRVVGFSLILAVVMMAFYTPLALPVAVASVADLLTQGVTSNGFNPDYKQSLWVIVFEAVWEEVIAMILGPIIFFCYGLLYTDIQYREEGLDIRRRLQAARGKIQEVQA